MGAQRPGVDGCVGPGAGDPRPAQPERRERGRLMTNLPHLTVTQTERGFAHLPPLEDTSGRGFSVYESSAAEEPCVWLNVSGEGKTYLHLDAETAWKLADQLRHAVRNHYQGDAT